MGGVTGSPDPGSGGGCPEAHRRRLCFGLTIISDLAISGGAAEQLLTTAMLLLVRLKSYLSSLFWVFARNVQVYTFMIPVNTCLGRAVDFAVALPV